VPIPICKKEVDDSMAIYNGDNTGETINTGGADDFINAKGGDDTVLAGSGDDVVNAGSGQDTVYGQGGDDVINGGQGDDTLYGGSDDDLLTGGQGQDQLSGGTGDDELRGGQGDDELFGGQGDDLLFGGQGQDDLNGGQGDDALFGGQGDDKINGGTNDGADDVLTGGPGSDTFVFDGEFGSDIITDFTADDKIDLTTYFGSEEVTFEAEGDDVIITVPGKGTITVQNASLADVIANTEIACLMRGTSVLTPKGEVAVEQLSIGDLVMTVDGVSAPVKWIGRRGYARAFVAASKNIAPVRFTAGSLGENIPARDLFVSPEHAMLVDEVLVPAKLLVNGHSIRQVSDFDMVEYFHVELDTAEVLITNGAPTESYVEHGNRRMFANYADYIAQHGEQDSEARKSRRFYEVHGGAALDAIRSRLDVEASVAA
jgi:hypothetical protein